MIHPITIWTRGVEYTLILFKTVCKDRRECLKSLDLQVSLFFSLLPNPNEFFLAVVLILLQYYPPLFRVEPSTFLLECPNQAFSFVLISPSQICLLIGANYSSNRRERTDFEQYTHHLQMYILVSFGSSLLSSLIACDYFC